MSETTAPEITDAARRDASRVTTVLGALFTAERELIAAMRAAMAIEDDDVHDAAMTALSEQRRALRRVRFGLSEA